MVECAFIGKVLGNRKLSSLAPRRAHFCSQSLCICLWLHLTSVAAASYSHFVEFGVVVCLE